MNNNKLTIELNRLNFFAYHGLYAEERKTGNNFEVGLRVEYEQLAEVIEDIDETINYATLYDIVKKQMQQPADLLETLVMKIAGEIHSLFPQIKKISITVSKLHPPIAGFEGNVAVTFSKEY